LIARVPFWSSAAVVESVSIRWIDKEKGGLMAVGYVMVCFLLLLLLFLRLFAFYLFRIARFIIVFAMIQPNQPTVTATAVARAQTPTDQPPPPYIYTLSVGWLVYLCCCLM
jgi:hypothetical protein